MAEVSTRLYGLLQFLVAFMPYLLGGLLAGSLVLGLGVLLARYLLWQWLLEFEKSLLLAARERANPWLDLWMTIVTFLAQGQVTIPITLLLSSILIYRHESALALILVITLSGSWFLNDIFKSFFRRKRPDLWASPNRPLDYSYPSGHSMSAASFYGLLAVYFSQWFAIPLAITLTVAVGISLGVGFSRLYLGVHWPTDVLSGWIAGGIWLATCLYGLYQIRGRLGPEPWCGLFC